MPGETERLHRGSVVTDHGDVVTTKGAAGSVCGSGPRLMGLCDEHSPHQSHGHSRRRGPCHPSGADGHVSSGCKIHVPNALSGALDSWIWDALSFPGLKTKSPQRKHSKVLFGCLYLGFRPCLVSRVHGHSRKRCVDDHAVAW